MAYSVRSSILLGALAAVLTAAGDVEAQVPPESNVAVGHALALQLCTPCHVVAADQPTAPILRDPAPSFASVAGRQGVTAEALRRFLLTTHATVGEPLKMPNPALVDYQVAPLVSYILSQRNQPAAAPSRVQPPSSTPAAPVNDPLFGRVIERSQQPLPRSLDELK